MAFKFHQGTYRPINPEKYVGRIDQIVYRSAWERRFLLYLDRNKGVEKFSSEETIIPYISPLDNKYHRYFMDFWLKTVNGDEFLVEVKPYKQVYPPVQKQGKAKRVFLNEAKTYLVNNAKWEAAEAYCQKRGMKFVIATDKRGKNDPLISKHTIWEIF